MTGAADPVEPIAGFYAPVHRALTEPILLGGAPRALAIVNGTLAGLEEDLPETFLRVHRSHIVNTAFVSALEREPSGIGRLTLTNATDVPVSRRIMPKVRTALAAA